MEKNHLELIQETVAELLTKAGFDVKIETKQTTEDGEESITCNVLTEGDSSFLIGQYGANLQALQHIIRLIVRKKTDDKIKFILDVNSYRQEKNQAVIGQAREAAQQALSEGRAVVLRPMSAYERRLIHMELANDDKVVTESIGEGESRKVVIKPASNL